MLENLDQFQEKYHPCYKCCLRICCSSKCDNFLEYHELIIEVIQSHFPSFNYLFQFYLGKFYFVGLTDLQVKSKLLFPNKRKTRQLKTKNEIIKILIKDIIEKNDL